MRAGLVCVIALGAATLGCTIPIEERVHAQGGRSLSTLAVMSLRPDPEFLKRVGAVAAAEASALITARVLEQLSERPGLNVIPPEEVERILAKTRQDGRKTPAALARTLSGAFPIDAYLTGVVEQFRERDGRPEGVTSPAAVRFRLSLRASDGVLLWDGLYDEEQQSLSAEPRSLTRAMDRSFRWVSAAALAHYGAEQLVTRLPGLAAR